MKRSRFPSKKPEGRPTRGKTAANRLRRVDNFLLLYDPALLRRTDGDFARVLFVDLGYGAEATTTLESAQSPARRGYKVRLERKWLTNGWLIWQQ